MLIRRIVLTAVAVSVLVGSMVIINARQTVSEIAVDRAIGGAMSISVMAAGILDEPGLPRRAGFQSMLDRFRPYQPRYSSGEYVFVLIRTLDGEETARLGSADLSDAQALAAIGRAGLPVPRSPGDAYHKIVELNDHYYVVLSVPLVNSSNRVAAYVEAIFRVSERELAKVDSRLWRATGAAVAIVALTALLLYPTILQLLRRVTDTSRRLLDANLEAIELLGSAVAKRDSDTDLHNYRVSVYAVRLAETLGLQAEQIRSLVKGAFLHDVGKLGIRDSILLKPGRLDENEFDEMKTHVTHGIDIVERSEWLRDAGQVVGHHHQRYDGSGYYGGLRGEQIPLNARIFAVADVFDALTSRRPYKEPMAFEKAMAVLHDGSGSHFDPAILAAFNTIARALYDEYASGGSDRARRDLEKIMDRYFRQDESLLLA
jgi:HD-GYP domain-containing protein (c-di-GMP phosphodiesterase class II)